MNRTKTSVEVLVLLVLVPIAFAAGWAMHRFKPGRNQPSSIAEHWQVVDEYRAYMNDFANYELSPDGLYGASEPFDHEQSLAALVDAGELMYLDIVLPTVPESSEANRHWMEFVQERDGIIEAYGNYYYVGFEVEGEQPLHLRLWIKENAMDDVKLLIDELEGLPQPADNNAQPQGSASPNRLEVGVTARELVD